MEAPLEPMSIRGPLPRPDFILDGKVLAPVEHKHVLAIVIDLHIYAVKIDRIGVKLALSLDTYSIVGELPSMGSDMTIHLAPSGSTKTTKHSFASL